MGSAVENKVKEFMKDELMREDVEFISSDDKLELDSLDQTELRVFLNEEYGIDTSIEKISVDSFSSLNAISKLIPEAAGIN